jgi:hypothetical protein
MSAARARREPTPMSMEPMSRRPALRPYTFLVWEDRGDGRAPLADRLAPARGRFVEKFGRPPTLVLVPAAEAAAGLDLPVWTYAGASAGELWLGAILDDEPATAAPTAGERPAARRRR